LERPPSDRPQLPYVLCHLFDDLGELGPLGSGDPGKLNTAWLDTQVLEEPFQSRGFSPSHIVSTDIVAIAGMASRNKHSVDAALKGLQDEEGIDPSRTGNTNHPNVGRILDPRRSREIGSGIGAPIAKKGQDLRLP